MLTYRLLLGDVRAQLQTLPDQCVQTCVTSPPFWGLRDYGHTEQIGLEPTPEAYVQALVAVFREVKRVLKDDGTLFLNLGDSFGWPKPKDLCGIPWSVAFALRADGWYLRSDIIWSKPNPMPESVTDRPTKAHEYLFLLTKQPSYLYDAEAIAEKSSESSGWTRQRAAGVNTWSYNDTEQRIDQTGQRIDGSTFGTIGSRNKRSVWHVATQPYPEAHFATFPEALIAPCILAGTSEKGECPSCGQAWERVVERDYEERRSGGRSPAHSDLKKYSASSVMRTNALPVSKTLGWQPICACDAGEPVAQVVLDPFCGSGTTGAVAIRHQRSFIGCELNPAYMTLARDRIGAVAPLFAQEQIA